MYYLCFDKAKEITLSKSNKTSNRSIDLIRSDKWGPLNKPSFDGYQYFLTSVDEFCRCTWVYHMRKKSETRTLFQLLFELIEKQFDIKMKSMRTSNVLNLS